MPYRASESARSAGSGSASGDPPAPAARAPARRRTRPRRRSRPPGRLMPSACSAATTRSAGSTVCPSRVAVRSVSPTIARPRRVSCRSAPLSTAIASRSASPSATPCRLSSAHGSSRSRRAASGPSVSATPGGELGLQAGAHEQLDDLVGRLRRPGSWRTAARPAAARPSGSFISRSAVTSSGAVIPAAGSSAAVRRPRPGQSPAAQKAAKTGSPAVAVAGARSSFGPALGIAERRRGDVLERGADGGGQPHAVGVERGLQLLGGARARRSGRRRRAGRAPRPARPPGAWCPGPRRR